MSDILAWYLHGITSNELPDSLDALRQIAVENRFKPETLLNTDKWDFLIREGEKDAKPGFVPLRQLASTKRGIATGANEFFHLSAPRAAELKLPSHVLVPCVGRAADVHGFEFSEGDLRALTTNGRRVFLATFGSSLTDAERRYITSGEASGIQERFLLAGRKPWYTMEPQRQAQIWAAVFGRQGLRFVHNRTNALTLTTFHCVYPIDRSDNAVAALTLCLNVPSVQAAARAHTRVYGGGLLKFEPRDLLDICVPDLSRADDSTLAALAAEQLRLSAELRAGVEYEDLKWEWAEELVRAAAMEATQSQRAPSEMRRRRTAPHLQPDARKRRDGPTVSPDARQ
jgi:adenine-specific DNA-methyltransferase